MIPLPIQASDRNMSMQLIAFDMTEANSTTQQFAIITLEVEIALDVWLEDSVTILYVPQEDPPARD
jgi:hypothetical protein